MWYVYSKYVGGQRLYGKEDCVGTFDTEREAIEKIERCYRTDKVLYQLGDYYYFMKRR